jgi:hypothetical protein
MPSTYEATALAVLALEAREGAPVADLGAYLLGGYSARAGWGDGRTNAVALAAVQRLFKDPVPARVALVLSRDGAVVAEGTFDASKLKEVVSLVGNAQGSGGRHAWALKAEPAVPGLGFSFALAAHVPWRPSPEAAGLMVTQAPLPSLVVGHAAELSFTVAAPSNVAVELQVSLPAGVQLDSEALSAKGLRFEQEDGLVTLHLPPLRAGTTHSVSLRVIPTLAGRLQAPPTRLAPEGQPSMARTFAPQTWLVAAAVMTPRL